MRSGSPAALQAAMERAKQAVLGRETDEKEPETRRYVWWLEFEATEEDAMAIRDFSRLLDSFEGRYYNRKGRI